MSRVPPGLVVFLAFMAGALTEAGLLHLFGVIK